MVLAHNHSCALCVVVITTTITTTISDVDCGAFDVFYVALVEVIYHLLISLTILCTLICRYDEVH